MFVGRLLITFAILVWFSVPGKVTDSIFVQPLKTPVPTDVTESGITMLSSPVHPLNALLPIDSRLSGSVILVREAQSLNASSPMDSRFSGSVILARFSQPSNTLSPIDSRLSGSVMFVRPVQPLNTLLPIVTRLSGRVMLARFSQPWKALSSNVVSPSQFSSESDTLLLALFIPCITDVRASVSAASMTAPDGRTSIISATHEEDTLPAKDTDSRFVHPVKTSDPTDVIVSGMTMLVRFSQPANALSGNEVSPSQSSRESVTYMFELLMAAVIAAKSSELDTMSVYGVSSSLALSTCNVSATLFEDTVYISERTTSESGMENVLFVDV